MGLDGNRFVAVFAAVVAPLIPAVAGLHFWEYLGNKEIRAVDRTFELYSTQFDPQKSGVAKLRMEMELKTKYEQIDEIIVPEQNVNVSQKEINEKFYNYIANNFDPKDFGKIITIRNFYEQISNCVTAQICDEKKARSLAGKEWKNFFALYKPIFERLQDKWDDPSVAKPLKVFYEVDPNG